MRKSSCHMKDGSVFTVFIQRILSGKSEYDVQFKKPGRIALEYELTQGAWRLNTLFQKLIWTVPASRFDIPKAISWITYEKAENWDSQLEQLEERNCLYLWI